MAINLDANPFNIILKGKYSVIFACKGSEFDFTNIRIKKSSKKG
ncbi:hypothetical protein EV06_1465 [Prochlorococcus sp. MIT 0602]|nr:hypothetical protein EV06_1465 [Prochlorococcus sp. MIT 0602]